MACLGRKANKKRIITGCICGEYGISGLALRTDVFLYTSGVFLSSFRVHHVGTWLERGHRTSIDTRALCESISQVIYDHDVVVSPFYPFTCPP